MAYSESIFWHTEVDLPKHQLLIDHRTAVMMVGSCFTDEVGARLCDGLLDVSVNPFGTLYNPMSIASAIEDAIYGRTFTADDVFEQDGMWHTFTRHSSFSRSDRQAAIDHLNSSLRAAADFLRRCDVLIVTLGSAIAFRLNTTGEIVANCHKVPASAFTRITLSVSDITARWSRLIERLRSINPHLHIIFTVSPVRHIGYGLTADRLSKSTLIVAVNEMTDAMTHYYPSYETVVDDLRDYRWYAADMTHPADSAVEYVFGGFARTYMSADTCRLIAQYRKIVRGLRHRYSCESARADAITRMTDAITAVDSDIAEVVLTRFNRLTE